MVNDGRLTTALLLAAGTGSRLRFRASRPPVENVNICALLNNVLASENNTISVNSTGRV
jgi:hypothetical protein